MDNGITRRALAPLAVGAALATTASCAPESHEPLSRQFPKDFIWGAATSAFQIEGSLDVDGRGASIWDVFQKNPAHIVDHSTAEIATDSYRRYKDDVALLKGANLNAYRFSISWSRVLPTGAGPVNEKGLDYYSRLVDALLEAHIAPYATLFHWDLPLALYEKGGWASRDTAKRLADYAALIGEKLGDRLKNYIILNEAAVHTIVGHVLGIGAPGTKDAGMIGPVTHHQNLGQGLAIEALRATRRDFKVGTTMALMPSRAPLWWHLRDRLAAYGFDSIWNRAYLDPLFKGSYPWPASAFIDSFVKGDDLKTVRQPVDFLGVNYYSPTYIEYTDSNPSHIGPAAPPKGVPLDAFGRQIDPGGLGETLARLRNNYGNPPLLITENGCSDPFSNGPALIDDGFRIRYLTQHLEVVKAAMERGSPIGGYFTWTSIDNWEWEQGFTAKFGMVAMDRKTGARTTKKSYAWFGELAKTGRLA